MSLPHPDGGHTVAPDRSRFAYLMLTHKEPLRVEELAHRILELSPRASIVVHHDLADTSPTPPAGHPSQPIHLVERGRVRWGDWSMIEATRRLLEFAVDRLDADWFVLLSGEHRPVVDLTSWEKAVARSDVDAIAPAMELPLRLRFGRSDEQTNLYLARSRHKWSIYGRPRSETIHRAIGALMKLSHSIQPLLAIEYVHRRDAWCVGRYRRAGPMGATTFFRGSQWIALNRRAATTVLDVEPEVTSWFKRSWIPDETYFQTVLRQAGGLAVSNSPTTFVLETPEHPTPGWMRLAHEDLEAVWASGAPFARKVDVSGRPDVVAAIDRVVDGQRAAASTNS